MAVIEGNPTFIPDSEFDLRYKDASTCFAIRRAVQYVVQFLQPEA